MKRVLPILLVGAAVLVLMDVVGALTGRPLGFPYPRLGAVSLLVYFGVGAIGIFFAHVHDLLAGHGCQGWQKQDSSFVTN